MKRHKLEVIVFVCGAVVMVLELIGSRVLAPYLGTSLFVWTSLIGIILGSLSLGYWWGGEKADRLSTYRELVKIIIWASVSVGVTGIIKEPILYVLQQIPDIRVSSVVATLILFAPASVLLGMVSPYAVKLKVKTLDTSGSTVGQLYAISTLGSIAGTFFAGFFLLEYLGNTKLIFILALVLLGVSFLAYARGFMILRILTVLCLLSVFFESIQTNFQRRHGIIDIDTMYNRIQIYDSKDVNTGRPIRSLTTSPSEIQSAIFLDGDDELVFDYSKFYRLDRHFKQDISCALLVGGGAYTFPRDFLKRFPRATIDVVEIDPSFVDLSKKYFGFQQDKRMNIIHEDGRTFINSMDKSYDVIYLDAYRSSYSIPFHLTTRETVGKLYESLTDNGIVLMNLISSIDGQQGKFLRAEYWTYKTIFPQVYVIPVQSAVDGLFVQNILLVALKSNQQPHWESDDPLLNDNLMHRWSDPIANDVPVFTDDYAPVDQYINVLMQ